MDRTAVGIFCFIRGWTTENLPAMLQSWWWSYGSWIYNYPCNQSLSPLKLCVCIKQTHNEVYSIQHSVI